jgi:hypothetical protein
MSFLVGDFVAPPSEQSLVLGEVTGSMEFLLQHATEFERSVLRKLESLIRGSHKYVEFKLRCKRTPAGQPFMKMAQPHYDVTMDLMRRELPEVHHLYVTPPLPTFWTVSPELEVIECPVPVGRILTYGRFSRHKTPILDEARTRLLIRATESDIIKPRNIAKGRG